MKDIMLRNNLILTILLIVQYIIIVTCNEFGYCIKNSDKSLKECFGKEALEFLDKIENNNNFTFFNGFKLNKDDSNALLQRSEINFLDQDPVDFRAMFENAGVVFSKRQMNWDLNSIHPGLQLRIGPSADTTSVLEFVMDDKELDERHYQIEEPSTARILTKRFILPLLLGLKFNLVTIIPLLFAGIIFLCQKAALLAKFAIFISSLLGVGGALSLGALSGSSFGGLGAALGGFGNQHGTYYHKPASTGLGGYADYDGYNRNGRKTNFDRPREFSTEESIIENKFFSSSTPIPDRFYDYEKNILLQDRNIEKQRYSREDQTNDPKEQRNFFWKTL